ncbi:autoinducer binding domain-containing protein [Marinomonas sp. RSW2]|uniref:Autoinducer binding domain-containing protein n=1 Tax=Marinomonas maritima TaxID=2940935 RepID=A0ABT5WD14_9GAMM|nr:autoinducer binding domain-containing protein [Marinomonas maritima]MDE8602707.1 autoinducer binding domain-containing protein [Marinomonas maritima]
MEYIDAIQSAQSIEEVVEAAEQFAKVLGFDYVSYIHRPHTPFAEPKLTIRSTYPKAWQNIYLGQEYFKYDPVVLHVKTSTAPLIWTAEGNFQSIPDLREDMAAFELNFGWCQATRNMAGTSMMSLSRPGEPMSQTEIHTHTPTLMWFTQVFNDALEKLISTASVIDTEVHLTNREIDVMRWTSDGKTSNEISVILGISERTVNFHLNNVMTKLDVNNRVAATVKAISLSLI